MSDELIEISASLTARILASELGGSENEWIRRMANWRKPGRNPRIPHIERSGKHPRYGLEDVKKFVATERASNPSLYLKPKNEDSATAVVIVSDDAIPSMRILWNTNAASGSFVMNVDQAKELLASLQRAVLLTQ